MDRELFDVTGDHAFVLLGPLACVIWRGRTGLEPVTRTEALGRRALERSPKGAGLLFFPESTTPSQQVRERSTVINARLVADGAVGVAGVFRRDGPVGAVQRGIATGMSLLADEPYPLRIFRRTLPACQWLGELLAERGVALDVERAAAAIDDTHRSFLEHGPSGL